MDIIKIQIVGKKKLAFQVNQLDHWMGGGKMFVIKHKVFNI